MIDHLPDVLRQGVAWLRRRALGALDGFPTDPAVVQYPRALTGASPFDLRELGEVTARQVAFKCARKVVCVMPGDLEATFGESGGTVLESALYRKAAIARYAIVFFVPLSCIVFTAGAQNNSCMRMCFEAM